MHLLIVRSRGAEEFNFCHFAYLFFPTLNSFVLTVTGSLDWILPCLAEPRQSDAQKINGFLGPWAVQVWALCQIAFLSKDLFSKTLQPLVSLSCRRLLRCYPPTFSYVTDKGAESMLSGGVPPTTPCTLFLVPFILHSIAASWPPTIIMHMINKERHRRTEKRFLKETARLLIAGPA
jgi:hypothetical protein